MFFSVLKKNHFIYIYLSILTGVLNLNKRAKRLTQACDLENVFLKLQTMLFPIALHYL